MKENKNWVEEQYKNLYKKYINSRSWFIILNILSFTFVASMVILNIYAIKKNPFENTKVLYVAIAILSGFIGLLTSLVSFFTLNKNSNKFKKQYEDVATQYKMYKNKEGQYEPIKNRDEVLIDEILRIIHVN